MLNNNPYSIFFHSIAYVTPYIILIEPRIFLTHLNCLLLKKSLYLNAMLRTLKANENPMVLKEISKFHLQICQSFSHLQQGLKVQIVFVFVKAFQDVLAAFYVLMKINEYGLVVKFGFLGLLAIFDLFLLMSPVEKLVVVVSK